MQQYSEKIEITEKIKEKLEKEVVKLKMCLN